jgi:hypothetical protein
MLTEAQMAYLDEARGKLRESAQITAVEDLDQTISDPPTQAEVQALSDKVDELLAAMRTSGHKAEPEVEE